MTYTSKKALITGGTRGIGKSTATLLAKLGCEVHMTYANSDAKAQELQQESDAFLGRIIAHKADNQNPEAIEAFGRDIASRHAFDFLILNAGTFTVGAIGDMTLSEYTRVATINEASVFALTNAVVKDMNDHGRIVIVSSQLGQRASMQGLSVYNASKAAVSMMARSWARDLAPRGILVNAVQPGPINTDLNPDSVENEGAQAQKAATPLGRYGTPEEVSALIQFLCSSDASFITGACINVDGGWGA